MRGRWTSEGKAPIVLLSFVGIALHSEAFWVRYTLKTSLGEVSP